MHESQDYNSIKGNMEKKAEKFKEFERQDPAVWSIAD